MANRELAYIVKNQKPVVLASSDTVRHACEAMWKSGSGSVLVVDVKRHLAGIFTGRDAVRFLAKGKDGNDTTLSAAMTKMPKTVAPNASVMDALRIMSDGGFRHVPVVDNGEIHGIVSRGDFKGMEIEEFKRRSKPAGHTPTARSVGDIVSGQKPVIVSVDATVQQACEAMAKRNSGSALVTDAKHHIVGIFTGRDAVHALAKSAKATSARIDSVMKAAPAVIGATQTAIDALHAMSDGGFRHLPVVDGQKVLGVVSRSDFIGIELDRLDEEERLREVLW